MKELDQVWEDIGRRHLSAIHEVETGKFLRSYDLKICIKNRIGSIQDNYKLKSDQCVILQKANSISFFVDFLALYFLGITVIPIDPETSQSDLSALIDSIKPALLINEVDHLVYESEGNKAFKDIALILFTSGSTSNPKGVMLSYPALERKFGLLEEKIGVDNVRNTLCFIPTYFGHGLICNSLFPIFCGDNFYIAKKLDIEFAEKLSTFLTTNNINFFSSVPSHWELITRFGKSYKEKSLKRVHSASSLLKNSQVSAILKWLGGDVKFFDVYGATEMSGWFASREVINNDVQGFFSDFWELEKENNSEGELILKSDYMFDGYWENGALVKRLKFNTGDIFRNSAIVGRTKNLININGVKIHAEDIVEDLLRSNLIDDAVAYSVSDDFAGERVGVAIVLKPNIVLENVWEYCRKHMSPIKIPGEIHILNKIPINSRGKVSVKEILKTIKEQSGIETKMLALFNQIFKTNYSSSHIARATVPDWDSMRHAELVIKIQDLLKIKFAVSEILRVNNFQELVNIVTHKRLK